MRNSRRSMPILTMAILVIAGCTSGPSPSAAATVDGTAIPRSDLEDAVTEITERTQSVDGADAEARAEVVGPLQRELLSLLVQATIIERLADDRGVEVETAAIERQLETDREELGGDEALAAALAQSQLTLPIYRDVLLPTQQRVEGLRSGLADELPDTQARTVRHILVEDADEADEIVELLDDGGDFAELAEERSTDPASAARGGDLGPASRGAYVDAFEQAVWEAELNEIVGPVETDFGFHVIEVTDESTVPVEDAAPATQSQALDGALSELLQASFGEAEVEVDAAFGAWDGDFGAVVEEAPVGSDG